MEFWTVLFWVAAGILPVADHFNPEQGKPGFPYIWLFTKKSQTVTAANNTFLDHQDYLVPF